MIYISADIINVYLISDSMERKKNSDIRRNFALGVLFKEEKQMEKFQR